MIQTMRDFINKLSFKDLKKQKKTLGEAIEYFDRQGLHRMRDDLEALRSLIDEIQDIAVDDYDCDENEVFDLTELTEEKKK